MEMRLREQGASLCALFTWFEAHRNGLHNGTRLSYPQGFLSDQTQSEFYRPSKPQVFWEIPQTGIYNGKDESYV